MVLEIGMKQFLIPVGLVIYIRIDVKRACFVAIHMLGGNEATRGLVRGRRTYVRIRYKTSPNK